MKEMPEGIVAGGIFFLDVGWLGTSVLGVTDILGEPMSPSFYSSLQCIVWGYLRALRLNYLCYSSKIIISGSSLFPIILIYAIEIGSLNLLGPALPGFRNNTLSR